MLLQLIPNRNQLIIQTLILLPQRINRQRRPNPSNNILTLRIHQVLTIKLILTRRRIPRKTNTSPRTLTLIPENHRLHINSSPNKPVNIIHPPISNRPIIIPRTKNSVDSHIQLLPRIIRKHPTRLLLNNSLITLNNFLQIFNTQITIQTNTLLFLNRFQNTLKRMMRNIHNNIPKHLNKSPIRIINKSLIALHRGYLRRRPHLRNHSLNTLIIQTQIQNSIHHPRQTNSRTTPNRNQQRITNITQPLTALFFKLPQLLTNLLLNLFRQLLIILIKRITSFSRNRKPLRNRQTNRSHLSKIRTLPTKDILHLLSPLLKRINKFFHRKPTYQKNPL